jgi:hypothetical protein
VVVLLTGDGCSEYPAMTCVMSVLGPYARGEAEAVATRQPDWTAPHVMALEGEVP